MERRKRKRDARRVKRGQEVAPLTQKSDADGGTRGGKQKEYSPKTRWGGSANPHKQGKAGVANEGAPAVRKAGVRTSSVPHQGKFQVLCWHHSPSSSWRACPTAGVCWLGSWRARRINGAPAHNRENGGRRM